MPRAHPTVTVDLSARVWYRPRDPAYIALGHEPEEEAMQIEVSFPGNHQVDASFKGHTVHTDQPEKAGGDNTGPAPFDLFLASIATCSGYYALRFCQQRQIATDGLRLTLEPIRDPQTRRLETLRMELHLPAGFPDKYRQAVLCSIDQCAVKRTISDPPEFEVVTA